MKITRRKNSSKCKTVRNDVKIAINVEILYSLKATYISKEILFKRRIRERNQDECENCYERYRTKKSRDCTRSRKSDPIYEPFCRERPSHFSILMPQKGQRAKSPSGDSPAGDVYRRKREREREGEKKRKRVRDRIGNSRHELKRIWRVECESCLIRRTVRN